MKRGLLQFFGFVLLAGVVSCADHDGQGAGGHDRMIFLLDSLNNSIDPATNQYANSARVAYYKNQAPDPKPGRRINQKALLASELLNSGNSEDAANLFTEVLDDLKKQGINNPKYAGTIESMLGISWLRVAEQDNCLKNHTGESCIYPIQKVAEHHIPKGADAAIQIYTKLLDENPEDYESKWLLNLCYMILGRYADDMPAKHKLPESIFQESTSIDPFVNIAADVGLDHIALSGGSVMEDFNNDGYLDLMCTSWGLNDQVKVFLNDGQGQFQDFTNQAGLKGIKGGLNAKAGDYNNDGVIDIFITRGGWKERAGELPNSLLEGIGDGTFKDVTIASGLLSFHPTQTMAWSDFNGDGWLDIFIGNESKRPIRHSCELYLNNQDGTFTESAQSLNVDIAGFVKGVVADDFDRDGRPDLFLSIHGEKNKLLRNRKSNNTQGLVFDDWTSKSGVSEPMASFPTWSFDYNNDGAPDIFVATYDMREGDNVKELLKLETTSDRCKLYKNNGDGTFEDVTEATGMDKVMLAMGSNFGDLNNDGFLDMYIGTGHPDFRLLMPNRAFLNINGERFEEVTNSARLGHLQKGHGVSFGDIDRDGDQDIFTVMGGAFEGDVFQNAMFINPIEPSNYLNLKLVGTASNVTSIGAQVEVVLQDGTVVHRTVTTGGSFGSSPLEMTIGLQEQIDHVNVQWPWSETAQSYKLKNNKSYILTEGDNIEREIVYQKINYEVN